MPPLTHRQRRRRAALAGVAAVVGLALIVSATLVVLQRRGVVVVRERCIATAADGTEVRLTPEQAANAATIAAVGVRAGVGERGVTIGLATAIQESKLRNLDHGDRDSLGLFQQRPSQGWGTPREVRDPVHASQRFFAALRQVGGYEQLPLTEAAQRVQRSAYPDAYADHEDDAAILAAALTGRRHGALSCSIRPADVAGEAMGAGGLTPRADRVRRELADAFGRQTVGGFQRGGVTSGHMEGSAHYDGRAVDVFFRPVDTRRRAAGWATAHWLVANADRLGIANVIYDDKIWSVRRSGDGWRAYVPPSRSGSSATLRHLDHVHVDVLAGS